MAKSIEEIIAENLAKKSASTKTGTAPTITTANTSSLKKSSDSGIV